MFSLDLYPKVLTLLLVLPPVLLGEQLRPQKIFQILPLVFYFVEAVVHKSILFNMVLLADIGVTVQRLEVGFCVLDGGLCICQIFPHRASSGVVIPYFSAYKTKFLKQSQTSRSILQDGSRSLRLLQSQTSRSILQDGSRSLRLFRKGKTHIIAKFHWTDLVICSHSKERKTPTYSRRNTVVPSAHRMSLKSHLIVYNCMDSARSAYHSPTNKHSPRHKITHGECPTKSL